MFKILQIISCLIVFSTPAWANNSEIALLRQEIELLKQKLNNIENPSNKQNISDEKNINATNNRKFDNRVKVGGKIDYDIAAFANNKAKQSKTSAIRSARIRVYGNIEQNWHYKIETDFKANKANLIKAYFDYNGFKKFNIRVGRFIPDFGLDSTNKLPESHPLNTLHKYDNNGVRLNTNGDDWYASIMAASTNGSTAKKKKNQSKTIFLRGSIAPLNSANKVLHIGASAAFFNPATYDYELQYKSQFENDISQTAVETPKINDISKAQTAGVDIGFLNGPLSMQAEYITAKVKRKGSISNNRFKGYYAQVAYSITGEQRQYKASEGSFKNIVMKQEFDLKEGTWGAFEVAMRYSTLDLNDHIIKGGKMRNISTSLNWYIKKNIYMMFNVIKAKTDKYAVLANNKPTIFLLRTHIDF